MKINFKSMLFASVVLNVASACVSSSAGDEGSRKAQPITLGERDGVLEVEGEDYPWLSPKHDKGIYSSAAETAPFKDNPLTYSNLNSRIQKTSKRSKRK